MEAIMIAGIAVVVVGGWYSIQDLLDDLGIRIKKPGRVTVRSHNFRAPCRFSSQGRVKQMAGMNI